MIRFITASISRRLYLLLTLFALGLVGVVGYQLYSLRTNLEDFKRTELQSVVQSATSIVQSYHDRAQAGEFTEDQAKQMALETLRGLRYQGKEYVFVDSFGMVLLMHPTKPEKQGSDRSVEQDGNGKLFMKEMIENASADGSAFVEYAFLDPETKNFLDKVTFAQAFEPWEWTIASGVLLIDVDAEFMEAATIAALVSLSVVLVLLAAGVVIARGIARPLVRLNTDMLAIADGRFDIALEGQDRRDEIGDMSRAVEVFRQNGLKVAEMTEAEAARIIRDDEARKDMMIELQAAFGSVVDAAVDGDFSRRVDKTFPDAELNSIANGLNALVDVVDRSIDATGEVLSALAQADLTKRVEGDFKGSLAQLKADTNSLAENMTQVMGQIRDTSRALKSATGEILAGANDLSERTTKQAATIEETSAAMEQLATTVSENAKKAHDAALRTESAAQLAQEGGQVMNEATVAMERISTSSSRISNIIGMIDDIAFQTNLLALNASVEAARAGEAGKGFAVVAVEVRRLAQSAAQASAEVKQLIEQSSQEVAGGSKLVDSAAAKLQAILQSVQENSAFMQAISSASKEQSSAIGEVTTAVRQMDEMTQHNAALVEETNAAIEQTEAQANDLDRVLDTFKIDETGTGKAVRAPAASKPALAQNGVNVLQQRVRTAAKSYLSQGNTALKDDWSEF
ncbi:methyl-accepting chemotaxis protein [Devosia naphthalenivorans]|uniref:methyl-accepting chemotaxis protein n=1 Tax=Devosia naphthalenivorans TaxID=2082392 RepID=UPI000D347F1B|nr:methyl-accepting chemotaxis protein [Devosia naphthalenivorans]